MVKISNSIKDKTRQARETVDQALLALKHSKLSDFRQGLRQKIEGKKEDLTLLVGESILRRAESVKKSLAKSKIKVKNFREATVETKQRVTKNINSSIQKAKKIKRK